MKVKSIMKFETSRESERDEAVFLASKPFNIKKPSNSIETKHSGVQSQKTHFGSL